MRIKADTYEFKHHNVYIPQDLKAMIEKEIKQNKNYSSVNTWIKSKNKSEYSSQAMIQVVNGKTKSPNVALLEELRRIVTKNGLATKFPDYKQLPIIRVDEARRIFGEDPHLRWKFVSDKTGIHSTVISNIIQENVGYRFQDAWKLTWFFIKYYEEPNKYKIEPTRWDYYGWVKEKQNAEGNMSPKELKEWRDQYNRRFSGTLGL